MTEEQKQALIEWLKPQIDELQNVSDEIPFGMDSDSAMHLNTMRVALAALTSPPVILPDDGLDDCIRDWPSQWRDNFDTGYNYASWRHQQAMEKAGVSFKREDE